MVWLEVKEVLIISEKLSKWSTFITEWKCRSVKLHWGKEQVGFTCVFGASQRSKWNIYLGIAENYYLRELYQHSQLDWRMQIYQNEVLIGFETKRDANTKSGVIRLQVKVLGDGIAEKRYQGSRVDDFWPNCLS